MRTTTKFGQRTKPGKCNQCGDLAEPNRKACARHLREARERTRRRRELSRQGEPLRVLGTRSLTALGVTRTIKEWAVQLGCSPPVLYARLATGWSADDAVSIPVGKHGGRQAARPTKPEKPASPRPAPTGLGFVSGSSLRREDCARYEACLTRAARTAGWAGCPAGCAGFERARRPESPGRGSTAGLLGAA